MPPDLHYLNSSQARASTTGIGGAELETLRHQSRTLSSLQSSLTVIPLENRVQRSNSNAGTAMMSGVLVSEATAIASLKPRPADSRGPKRLTMTTSTPRLIVVFVCSAI